MSSPLRCRSFRVGLVGALVGCVAPVDFDPVHRPGTDPVPDTADTDVLPEPDTEPDTAVFTEVGVQAGLVHEHRERATPRSYLECSVGDLTTGAVAVADFDGDGFDDLFFPVYDGADRLYRNLGDGTFEDITEASGLAYSRYSSSAVFTDVDGDGLLDLIVGRLIGEPLRAWRQSQPGRFEEATDAFGLRYSYDADACAMTWSLSLADLDSDEDLDLLMGVWRDKIHGEPGFGSLVWRRQQDGTFRAESLELPQRSYGFTPAAADFDGDGLIDLGLASDFRTNELLWAEPDGFVRASSQTGVHTVEAGMGSAILDLDNDGELDWLVTSIFDARPDLPESEPQLGNMAYLYRGDRRFEEAANELGLADAGWAWGVAVADFDLDGLDDLAITNGWDEGPGAEHVYAPFLQDPTRLFMRATPTGPFADVAGESGIGHTGQGRAIVAFDLENDGDDDLLIVNQVGRPTLYRNELQSTSGGVTVALRQPGPNPHGLGSQVWVQQAPDGPELRRDIHGNASFLSQVPPRVRVGIGPDRSGLHRVRVVWPDGQEQLFEDVGPGLLEVAR